MFFVVQALTYKDKLQQFVILSASSKPKEREKTMFFKVSSTAPKYSALSDHISMFSIAPLHQHFVEHSAPCLFA